MRSLVLTCVSVSLLSSPLMADYPIAGTEPSQRPASAPVMEWVNRDSAWYQSALIGVNQPYPKSLYFLDNQGHWNTPFNRPGMTGRYDIRKWHQ
ncbi:MAG: hypothetical protein B6D72_19760 [gamma proteobacterium symbiont of Ctena orbiculata]|nr:MAG: hypothetical protein DBP00_19150 [gamma proteobacterium symbiont of Ctena orbiculata]PVV06740.1 MAG: hypothetical protein B6D72_19760 [gamma proteobacterium symbiont of Ctena orbiculata]PVV13435.1 MAG: hypothetical protein B6D82_07995 [gamma proteobacterium symbiont of Ctena orbiculata]PVV19374.1 MAG: hypothetical protein B6D74_14770 [gamma proteobacterium symbiont of Ctena orbiculata]